MTLPQLRQLAIQYQRDGKLDQAGKIYRAILKIQPTDTACWCNLGAALRAQKHFQSAINCYRRALDLKPGDLHALGNLANALKDAHRLDEALEVHRQVLTQKPNDSQALINYACALRENGDFSEALNQLGCAQRLEPKNAGIEWERAQNLLYLGRFTEGWLAYEARWRTGDLSLPKLKCPQWQGEDIAGKHILLHTEQGYGDTILAARFIPQVKERVGSAGTVTLQCKPELHRLFRTIGGDHLIAPTQTAHAIDVHCPLMSLMGCFNTQSDSIPLPAQLFIPEEARKKFAYLSGTKFPSPPGRGGRGEGKNPDDEATDSLTLALSRGERELKIGIVWSGSITFKNNDNRALPLSSFLPLAEIPNVRLYSLQKGPRQVELQENGVEAYIEDLGSHCDDFADTAAAIENLDMIVMTDSSVAHLAASLNKPVINIVSKIPYWLYALDKHTTPWYPSMRLVERDEAGMWRQQVHQLISKR
jgi:hypothetical protein